MGRRDHFHLRKSRRASFVNGYEKKADRHYRPGNKTLRLWPLPAAAGVLGLALLVFALLRENSLVMDALYQCFTAPWHRFAGWTTGFFPFSVAELLVLFFVLACLFFLCKAVRDMVRRPSLRLVIKKIRIACVAVLTVFTGISYL